MLPNILRQSRSTSNRLSPLLLLRSIMTSNIAKGPVSEAIAEKLTSSFSPVHLEVRNESHMHNVPIGSETHFKVVVISEKFKDARTPLKRHRLVNDTLKLEVAADGPVHALSIVAMTPDKWQEKVEKGEAGVRPSPSCRGGDGSLPKRN
mmetsp:Transcript_13186/g.19908  ORF Transcript_13186/g.19908 Transcript_13186/m.19908 type:complete len:149 (+) Transcript_13186:100-546(+)